MPQLLQKAGKQLFKKHLQRFAPQDPLYECYTDSRGRQRRKQREPPPGLPERDAKVLRSVQRRAHYLDKSFSIAGFRFGWTFLLGIVPLAGDVATALLNYVLVVRKAREADIPQALVQHMLFNNAVSVGVGLIPLVGDVLLAIYKANSRNAALLEKHLKTRVSENVKI
ncbi:putative protein with domain of unknown function (DUF4112) [Lyophyllum shimeji]|uniref:Uncharacterized protein n=1 Tax=Lyophyllum shimeji TaxID=47721 RepID=A0A9P3Q0I9_LYOSH|nr:putative protein with domain of unknown function (DUF4112) [Lyophyllum shimeji]